MNYRSAGTVIVDSVTALGVMIAFYYGLTGSGLRLVLPQGPLEGAEPVHAGGLCRCWAGRSCGPSAGYSLAQDWDVGSSYTSWRVPGVHWHVGGAFVLAVGSLILGVILMLDLLGHVARRSSGARCSTATRPPSSPRTSGRRSVSSASNRNRSRRPGTPRRPSVRRDHRGPEGGQGGRVPGGHHSRRRSGTHHPRAHRLRRTGGGSRLLDHRRGIRPHRGRDPGRPRRHLGGGRPDSRGQRAGGRSSTAGSAAPRTGPVHLSPLGRFSGVHRRPRGRGQHRHRLRDGPPGG